MKRIAVALLIFGLVAPAIARPIQKSLNTIIYALPVAPPAGQTVPVGQPMFWLSDFPTATGSTAVCSAHPRDPVGCDALNWILPPWFPRQAYIVSATIGQQQPPDGKQGQVAVGIDRKGLSYRNALPPYHQAGGDQQWDRIGSMWLGGMQEQDFPVLGAPKFLDRDAGDRLWLQIDASAFVVPGTGIPSITTATGTTPGIPAVYMPRTIWVTLHYEADSADVTAAPVTGWNSLFGPMTMEGFGTGWIDFTGVQTVSADWTEGFVSGPGTKTRVTFSADHIGSAYVCERVPFTLQQCTNMHQLTFGGNPGAAANAAGIIVSDDMPFGLDPTNGLEVRFHTIDGSVRNRVVQPSAKSYYKAGDDAANPNGSGYSADAIAVRGVVNIEQFY